MSSLGNAIRHARRQVDWSQKELARQMGVSQTTISFWERDVEMPRLEHVVKLLLYFPQLIDTLRISDQELMQQLHQLERTLTNATGKCACENCTCQETRNPLHSC
ncbi:MAG: helix-turn-helix transcriptional regulator [Chloroflexi bacterium]|nr:helix-turn-helix transcriptional regulator [Chloroflexota bacterium]